MRYFIAVCFGFLITASTVLAQEWEDVASLTAGGDAKEVTLSQEVSKVMFKCTEGSVIINTLVVRKGDEKLPFRVSTRIDEDEAQLLKIGDKVNVTGFRISDDGEGKYVVKVKK